MLVLMLTCTREHGRDDRGLGAMKMQMQDMCWPYPNGQADDEYHDHDEWHVEPVQPWHNETATAGRAGGKRDVVTKI